MGNSARDKLSVNARRLFDDAKLLNDQGRYASVVALAILAVEEVGKRHLYDLKHHDQNLLQGGRFPPRHTDKQAAFAVPFVNLVQRQAMIQICKQFGSDDWKNARGTDDWEKTQDFLVEGYVVSQYDDSAERRKRALDILNTISAFIDLRVANHPLACLMRLAYTGDIDKQKQAAFYLDIADDGTVISDPAEVGENGAAFWLDIAAVAIESLSSMEAAESAAERFAERYKTFAPPQEPKPPPSAEDWKNLFEKLNERSIRRKGN